MHRRWRYLLSMLFVGTCLLVTSTRQCQMRDAKSGERCPHKVASPYDIYCPKHLPRDATDPSGRGRAD